MGLHKTKEIDRLGLAKQWMIPAILLTAGIIAELFGDAGREWLRYDRVAIPHGESWRLISGHITHLGWQHLTLNGCGLVLVWFLVGRAIEVRYWLPIIAIIVATIDVSFWLLNPELYWYVGMSGLLHGLLVAGAVARLPTWDGETIALLGLLTAKVAWEQFSGPMPGSESTSGGPVVIDAHLYGAIGGLLGALVTRIRVGRHAAI